MLQFKCTAIGRYSKIQAVSPTIRPYTSLTHQSDSKQSVSNKSHLFQSFFILSRLFFLCFQRIFWLLPTQNCSKNGIIIILNSKYVNRETDRKQLISKICTQNYAFFHKTTFHITLNIYLHYTRIKAKLVEISLGSIVKLAMPSVEEQRNIYIVFRLESK